MTTIPFLLPDEERIKPVFKRDLINLVGEASDNFTDKQIDTYRSLGVATDPLTERAEKPSKVPFYLDVAHQFDTEIGTICGIPIAICFGDAAYNRTKEINWSQILTNLDYSKGFSYSACSIIEVVFVRKTGKFIVKKGQHRVIMAWLCLGEDAIINANVKVVDDEEYTEEEQIRAEAHEHHVDAQKIARQKAHQSGLSGFCAGDKDEVNYTNWILSHGVGVKGKMHLFPELKFPKVCDTPWAVKAARLIDEENCSRALLILNRFLPSSDKMIGGKSIKATTQYLTLFNEKIEKTASINGISKETFVENVFDYIWHQRKTRSSAWLKGSSAFRGENIIIPLARLVKFTNAYCQENDIRLPDGRKTEDSAWCSVDEKFWCDYLNKTTPKELHGSVNAIVTEC